MCEFVLKNWEEGFWYSSETAECILLRQQLRLEKKRGCKAIGRETCLRYFMWAKYMAFEFKIHNAQQDNLPFNLCPF